MRSLRGRLLLAMLALVAAGLLASGVATWLALRSFLVGRVDQELAAARLQVAEAVGTGGPAALGAFERQGAARLGLDSGWVEVSSGGRRLRLVPLDPANPRHERGWQGPPWLGRDGAGRAPPELPDDLPDRVVRLTVQPEGHRGVPYRVQAGPVAGGDLVVAVAVPLSGVFETLGRLILVEALASAAVLVGLGLLALRLVRLGLRPLDDIAATAGAIAAGDLSRRVGPAEPTTEVGRLGLALNAMLGQIEAAFAERRASEARLRRFVADASHELRTPLTSIRGYAELFRRGADARPEDLATTMQRIEEEAERMGGLVDELLLLARLDQGRPLQRAPVDLAVVAAEAVEQARVIDPERPLELDTDGPVVVLGDQQRLRQVAANLLANVRMHTAAGTAARVEVSAGDGRGVLEVVDHGQGLSQEQAARVFDRFYRTDPARARSKGGAGLGLSIVAAIAQAHGGRASVASAPGRGARFRIELPLAQAPP
ncbi:MAG TPA: HAMP domain-containing sensor histidine kinase [Actinomycetota bacterium]|nr:HAMP domain-containing sensor histidine kinase [Actinomycetota bacterium]